MNGPWLDALKPGDLVVVSWGFNSPDSLVRVDRITATQIIVNEVRYRKADGYQVGSTGWGRPRILEATPELIAKTKRRSLVERLKRIDWSKLPDAVLEAVERATKQ